MKSSASTRYKKKRKKKKKTSVFAMPLAPLDVLFETERNESNHGCDTPTNLALVEGRERGGGRRRRRRRRTLVSQKHNIHCVGSTCHATSKGVTTTDSRRRRGEARRRQGKSEAKARRRQGEGEPGQGGLRCTA
jgi:hypothetical protein